MSPRFSLASLIFSSRVAWQVEGHHATSNSAEMAISSREDSPCIDMIWILESPLP